MKKFKRIDRKLLSLFLVFVIVPLVIIMFFSYHVGKKTVKQQTFENLELTAAAVKGHVYTFIESQKNIARDFSSDKEIIRSLKLLNISSYNNTSVFDELKNHIIYQKMVLYSPVLLDISILDHTGKVIFSTNEERIGRDESFNDYFLKVKSEGFFGDVHHSQEFNEPIFEVSAPIIENETSMLLGIIVNSISGSILANITKSSWLEKFGGVNDLEAIGSYFYGKNSAGSGKKKLTYKTKDNTNGDVYIVNKDKRMITESGWVNNAILKQLVDTVPVRKALEENIEMVGIYKDYRGVPMIGASVLINEMQWVIVVEKDLSYIFESIFKLKAQMITFGILFFGIVVLVSTLISKKFTDPIKLLVEATKMRSVGDINFRVNKTSDDEFGDLFLSFNKMCDDIQKTSISRDFFERILNGMSDSVIITDMDCKIKISNPVTYNMLDYKEPELIDKPFTKIIKEKLVILDYEELKKLSIRTVSYILKDVQATYIKNDGNNIPVSISSFFTWDCKHKQHINDCVVFIKLGGCANCLGISIVNIAHDISHHKRTEAKLLKEKEAAEYTARVRSEFLANMSHEVRTPLNAILGMSEVLQEQIYGQLNEKQVKSLRSIDISGRHLLSVINDILDISKIEAGMLQLEFNRISVKSVCDTSMIFIKEQANKKRIKLTTTIDKNLTEIQADERRLKQILVNLLSNAVKFTNENGSIALEVTGNTEKLLVNFVVRDTGIGISQEHLGMLFTPYTQLDSAVLTEQTGTGLGLYIVRQMAELHGGRVSVESEQGKGSSFTVTLPWRTAAKIELSEQKQKLPSISFNKNNKCIMVIGESDKEISNKQALVLITDDNEENLNIFNSYLKAKGFMVILARNGQEALTLAGKMKPDIILMDIHMPVMNGLDACRAIRSNPDLVDVNIIVLTASAMLNDTANERKMCLEAGANDYMTKPVSLKELFETMKKMLRIKNIG